ncbi:hypothetical protein AS180_17930 [Priestia veravalensis]|uniref:Uncharacterized protein n=1 Tax=Priestia veravalensis TaxID=1414648 RepID=A0A0V8JHQ2_9BACI|nr:MULTISPECIES: hypothetical protein [Priestia]KSU86567.1 hypothetical protein AS180_17930 [Priestia veravalensis]SCC50768.1 hypothetical protein GA0061087_106616 [Priestia flexa]
MAEKIIQIIPAPKNLYAVYQDDEHPKEPILSKIICLGLTDQGEVVLMDMDETGFIDMADNAMNYKGAKWGGE